MLEPLETALLEACRPCFADELRLPSAATCTEIAQRALVLERGAAEARNGILRADTTRESLLGDWRLVFTSSEVTAKGGVTGFGAAPLCGTKAVLQRMSANDGVNLGANSVRRGTEHAAGPSQCRCAEGHLDGGSG